MTIAPEEGHPLHAGVMAKLGGDRRRIAYAAALVPRLRKPGAKGH